MEETIETHQNVESVAAEWDELARRVGASPFDRPGWLSCWLGAFGAKGLSILALRRAGRLEGVLPTLRRGGVIVSPTNWHSPGFGAVAVDSATEASLIASLLESRPRRIDLSFLTAESADRLRAAGGKRRFASRVITRSPYIEIDQPWDAYWESLSGNHRGNIRRRRRRLAELGEVELEICEGGEGLERLLAESFHIEASGWKGERGTAMGSSPETRRFYESVATWATEADLLCLASLRLDGSMVAFNLSLEDEKAHYLLKLGHDPALGKWSPGTVLTAAMIERAFSLGLRRYEFLGDDDPYKLRWTQTCHELVRAQSFGTNPSARFDEFVQTTGRALVKRAAGYVRRGRR